MCVKAEIHLNLFRNTIFRKKELFGEDLVKIFCKFSCTRSWFVCQCKLPWYILLEQKQTFLNSDTWIKSSGKGITGQRYYSELLHDIQYHYLLKFNWSIATETIYYPELNQILNPGSIHDMIYQLHMLDGTWKNREFSIVHERRHMWRHV